MEKENGSKLGVTILYALVGAFIGGILWGAIMVIFNYQLGIIALAIGGITGYAVVFAAKEHITQAHRLVAVIASLIGIVIGKYIGFAYFFNDGFERFLAPFTRASFGQYFSELFGFMDIVFIIFAMFTAWQIPTRFAQEKYQQVDIGNKDDEENIETVLDSSTLEETAQNETAASNDSNQQQTNNDSQ